MMILVPSRTTQDISLRLRLTTGMTTTPSHTRPSRMPEVSPSEDGVSHNLHGHRRTRTIDGRLTYEGPSRLSFEANRTSTNQMKMTVGCEYAFSGVLCKLMTVMLNDLASWLHYLTSFFNSTARIEGLENSESLERESKV